MDNHSPRPGTSEHGHSGNKEMPIRPLLIIALCYAFMFGCERKPNVMSPRHTYVVACYEDSDALTLAGEEWGRAINPWLHGKEVDIDSLLAAEEHITQTTESIRSKFDARKVPDSPDVREFAALVADYLDWQIELQKELVTWRETVRSENPAAASTRQAVFDNLHELNDKELEWKSRIHRLGAKLGVTVEP